VNIRKDDVLTPANAISTIGLILSVHGAANIASLQGVIEIGLGRLLDIVDGSVARRTHSSHFGAIIDAIFDKLSVAAIAYQAWQYDIAPKVLISFIVVQNLINSVIAIYAEKKNLKLESSNEGKYTILLQNLALGGLALVNVLDDNTIVHVIELLSLTFGFASYALGTRATFGYFLKVKSLR